MSESASAASPTVDPVETLSPAAYWSRIRGLLLAPSEEWRIIAAETPTLQRLFLYWVAPLVFAFFLAPQLGAMAFPPQFNGVAAPPSAVRALYTILVGGALAVGGVWAFGQIVDFFAPHFGGRRDPIRSMQLAAYSGLALWLSGLFGLAPPLWFLSVAGIASVYTLYRGLPPMTGAPQDRALSYAAVVIACGAVMGVVLMSLSTCVAIVGGGSALAERRAAVPVAAVASPLAVAPAPIDPAAPIDADKLRRLLPDAMPGGWIRAGLERNAGGALGFTGPTLSARYENGARRLRLDAIDLGPDHAAAAIAQNRLARPARDVAGVTIRHSEEGAPYVYEETDAQAAVVRRLVVRGDRLALYAEGAGGASLDDLRAAVDGLDPVRVDQIARGL